MNNALIGYSGFVGGTLLTQARFDSLFRSANIQDIEGRAFDTVVCAGAPAMKWLANRDPEADRLTIDRLIEHLATVQCKNFILISTVDVFSNPVDIDEDSTVDESGLHAYGLHRRMLEKFVEDRFSNHLIVRLPGLVGPGLRKNVIFDFLNDNDLHKIDHRGVFQFYPMANLWSDLQIGIGAGLRLLHLTAEPISVAAVAAQGFGKAFDNTLAATPARYDLKTRHAGIFGATGDYQYRATDTVQAIRSYAQSEPRAKINKPGTPP